MKKIKNEKNKNKKGKGKGDEPPPLVSLNDIKISKYERLSNNALGIKLTDNVIKNNNLPQIKQRPTQFFYQTGLSNVAQRQSQCGMFHQQDLNQIIQLRYFRYFFFFV